MEKTIKPRYLIYDLNRYFYPNDSVDFCGTFRKIKKIFLIQGIWAILVYRSGCWIIRKRKQNRVSSMFLKIPMMGFTILQKTVEILTGISIPFSATIGKGLYIGHFGGIILGGEIIIGEFCNISQGVTIGQGGRGGKQLSPVIGDRVYIAPGAKVFGGIRIGNDVAIGANAVVNDDVPDNAVVVGIPGKIINYSSSKDFVLFNKRVNQFLDSSEL